MEEADFRRLFEGYGTIVSIKCISAKKIGFVKMETPKDAQAAIDAMDGFDYNGSQLVVKLASNDKGEGKGKEWDSWGKGAWAWMMMKGWGGKGWGGGGSQQEEEVVGDNLYIKGLPPAMTESKLHEIFGAYGTVTQVRVLETNGFSPDGEGESVALMRMGSVDEATWLVQNLNGNIPQGIEKPVQVKYANAKGAYRGDDMKGWGKGWWMPPWVAKGMWGKGWQSQALPSMGSGYSAGSNEEGTNLYVKDLSPAADDLFLYRAFARFGAIESARAMVNPDGSCTGIGFVKFATAADAQKAIGVLNGAQQPDGQIMYVSIKTDKRTDKDREKGSGKKS
eukprot:gnl/TRDRNA2_/TRDRNA2_42537_c0_seq1.p1 gnl/TRDRNA2_/TRDRNA2_42537_c0~~gnl/TRDRNA2_/TRDRNA2_42537_c0_seq1.p1  ORF type:complete len:376 (-),score=88.14 gnl/TRDRNA2_/TRDRNA2_42537_c0_seq1:96-1103(-)